MSTLDAMIPRPLAGVLGTTLAIAMAAAGLALRDCMLIATSVALAYRLFLLRMDRVAPWPALKATVHVLAAAALVGAAGLGLVVGVAGVGLNWWHPSVPHSPLSLLFLAVGALWCCASRDSRAGAADELGVWLWMLGGSLLALEAHRDGLAIAPCLFVAGVGLALVGAGWRLASVTATGLLRAGSEPR